MTIINKFLTVKRKGIKWCFFCKGQTIVLKALSKIYGFDDWHANNPPSCRPYKEYVANLVNHLKPRVVVEVGCGLGDILAMVNCKTKYGIDLDKGAIKAAKILHPFSHTMFIEGDLSKVSEIKSRIDVLFAIGWVHLVSPKYLENEILKIKDNLSYIVLDRFVDWDNPPFKHDFKFIEKFASLENLCSCDTDGIREYLIYRVRK